MLDVLVDGVSFSYDKKNVILGNIDMKVEAGSFVCILGQSGCGKSTLLRLLSGLEKPDSGRILIQGSELGEPNLNLGLVFQNQGLFPWMTAGENIDIALKKKFPKMSKDERKESAISYIEEVGLKASCFDKLPKELSGGMQQRCAIARAFSIDPPILLMDEPFGALDAVTRSNLQDLVLELWRKEENKKTIFFITHDVDEALYLATDIFVLGQSPSEVIYRYSFENKESFSREELHSDDKFLGLRNKFVKILYDEVKNTREEKSC